MDDTQKRARQEFVELFAQKRHSKNLQGDLQCAYSLCRCQYSVARDSRAATNKASNPLGKESIALLRSRQLNTSELSVSKTSLAQRNIPILEVRIIMKSSEPS